MKGRIHEPLSQVLMDGLRLVDECKRQREVICGPSDALLAIAAPTSATNELANQILTLLASPRTLDELLDELPDQDLEVLQATAKLIEDHAISRNRIGRTTYPTGRKRTRSSPSVHYHARAASRISWQPNRLNGDASRTQYRGSCPSATRRNLCFPPTPRRRSPRLTNSAHLRLGDSLDLKIVGIPLVDNLAPLWALALPGTVMIVNLEQSRHREFFDLCEESGVAIYDASTTATLDPADPKQLANLLTMALDSLATPK